MTPRRKANPFAYQVACVLDEADRKFLGFVAEQEKSSVSQVIRSLVSAARKAHEEQIQAQQRAFWQARALQQQRQHGGAGA
jgi:hypothetical protein